MGHRDGGSLHPHLQLTPTGDRITASLRVVPTEGQESWGVHAPGITILDEGLPEPQYCQPAQCGPSSLLGLQNPWQSHTCLLCCLCLNQTRGGLNQTGEGTGPTWASS